jgi:hypothetical protein
MRSIFTHMSWLLFAFTASSSNEAGEGLTDGSGHWAFQAIADAALPVVKTAAWIQSPVDTFVLKELERRELTPTHPADKRTLIRRATFDLIGLPPTPEEVDAFVQDDSPDAFSSLVDRLLASPHYGERWGRHWLDVVRYADTAGCNSDFPIPQTYRFRNYVINSFNRDKPYDVFIQEQVAGDLMPACGEAQKHERIIATGYLALTLRFGSDVITFPRHLMIEDTINNLGRAVLALNIQCARCHDHKFDPISTADYYGLYGIFDSSRYPFPGIETLKVQRDFVPLISATDYDELVKPYNDEVGVLEARRKELTKRLQAVEEKLKEGRAALLEENLDAETRARLEEEVGKNQKKRTEIFPKWIEAGKAFSETAQAKKPVVADAYAMADAAPKNAKIHIKGDPKKLGDEVSRGFPAILGGERVSEDSQSSGRLELSKWLTRAANPLTSRVMVNRLWQYHFGKGLVKTPNDFGRQGRVPTHPNLLDYLATRFIANNWSIKAMHRLIMLSSTYQLDSRGQDQNARIDPNNAYFWKFNRQRLVAESVRDSMLFIGGGLDRSSSTTPHPFPDPKEWDYTQHEPFNAVYESRLRSVYLMVQRQSKHPLFAVFDGPDPTSSTGKRTTTTTPIQALFMMNDPFVHEHAGHFSRRILTESVKDASRVQRAFELTLSRPPTKDELSESVDYLARIRERLVALDVASEEHEIRTWESFARAMLRTNEFIYID